MTLEEALQIIDGVTFPEHVFREIMGLGASERLPYVDDSDIDPDSGYEQAMYRSLIRGVEPKVAFLYHQHDVMRRWIARVRPHMLATWDKAWELRTCDKDMLPLLIAVHEATTPSTRRRRKGKRR